MDSPEPQDSSEKSEISSPKSQKSSVEDINLGHKNLEISEDFTENEKESKEDSYGNDSYEEFSEEPEIKESNKTISEKDITEQEESYGEDFEIDSQHNDSSYEKVF